MSAITSIVNLNSRVNFIFFFGGLALFLTLGFALAEADDFFIESPHNPLILVFDHLVAHSAHGDYLKIGIVPEPISQSSDMNV